MKNYVVAIDTIIEGRHRTAGEPVMLDEKVAQGYSGADLVVTPEEWEKRSKARAKAAESPKAAK